MTTPSALNVFSPTWVRPSSYGRIAHELRDALLSSGVGAVNMIGGEAPTNVPIRLAFGGFLLGYPTLYPHFGALSQHGRRVALAMFESDKIPDIWAYFLNQLDAVVVPSKWLIDVFRQGGITIPIHCIPLGVSQSFFEVERTEFREPSLDHPFTFVSIADRGSRKGFDSAGFAFVRAFGDDMRYRLLLKCRPGAFDEIPWFAGFSNPNIELIEEDYDDDEMAAFYARTDCMIHAATGEGFGLPPREYAATGGISLVTNWSGTADDIEQYSIPLAITGLQTAWIDDKKHNRLGRWAKVDVDNLAAQMKWVASRSPALRQALGAEFRENVRRLYQWSAFGAGMLGVWKGIDDGYADAA